MKNSKKILGFSAAMVAYGLWLGGSAQGAVQLLQFEATPISPATPEFSWVASPAGGPGISFVDEAGSHGNGYPTFPTPPSPGSGDGNQPVTNQNPGGLEVDVPFTVGGLGSQAGAVSDGHGGTIFYDVTLLLSSVNHTTGQLTGDLASGPSDQGSVLQGINVGVQPLTPGDFSLYATDGELLLTGHLDDNSFSSPLGGSSVGFQSGDVTYTDGAILHAFSAGPESGSGAISMTTLDGPVQANYDSADGIGGFLNPTPATFNFFQANATGVFDVSAIPEPASLSLLAMAGILGLRRRH